MTPLLTRLRDFVGSPPGRDDSPLSRLDARRVLALYDAANKGHAALRVLLREAGIDPDKQGTSKQFGKALAAMEQP